MIGTLLLPTQKQDVGDLEPIQAVWLRIEDGNIVLQTDTDDVGIGTDVHQALEDMKLHSPGIVYLDTAEYLLADENAVDRIKELKGILKGSVRVCLWEGEGEVADAARYMQSHKSGVKLENWKQENLPEKLPKIY